MKTSFRRINVVGSTGSGKSTLAKKLAAVLDMPYLEIDQIYWEPDWTEPSDQKFFPKLESALAQESWVLDGNYNRTRPIKWKNVQLVVWLDYSFARTLQQSLRRVVKRAIKKQELWPGTGNRESFRRSFLSRQSILLWMLQNYSKVRRQYLADMTNPSFAPIQFVRLRSPRETRAWLEMLRLG